MAERRKVIIDAGHGGTEPGAIYEERQEKDDALRLALAVGNILSQEGADVVYTRVNDVYDNPYEKAAIANRSGADYFVSIHRNAMPTPNTASGTMSLVYKNAGIAGLLAKNINAALQEIGFADLGIVERPGLVVLRDTKMPAAMIEVGFIDSDEDNQFFDQNFQSIAEAIAYGILLTMEQEAAAVPEYYQVQTGSYRNQAFAQQQLKQLTAQGFPAYIVFQDGLYKVRAGAFLNLDYAVRMERMLKDYGYNTFIVKEKASK